MSNQIITPKIMQIGQGAIQTLPKTLAALGVARPLIVTDQMMVSLGYVDQILQILTEQQIRAAVFKETIAEPTCASIYPAVDCAKQGDFDCIIALGGGSPIDSAKAISILAKHGGKIEEYKVPTTIDQKGLPIIAIPTTAGTGSECTCFTIITNEVNDEKMLCQGIGFMPAAAIVDYQLTLSLPQRITADTGIDALTHAIEAYVSQKANLYSDCQALSAMRLIAPNLRKAYHNGQDIEARQSLMLGSTLAGIAFSNASVALVHGMSRPLGAAFHIPHGLSNAMLLPQITQYSIPAAEKRYAECAVAMGIAQPSDSVDTATTKLINELYALNEELAVPSLQAFGVDEQAFEQLLPIMASQALASGSPQNNPLVPTQTDIIQLYQQVWSQTTTHREIVI